jgi:hypothetical protein
VAGNDDLNPRAILAKAPQMEPLLFLVLGHRLSMATQRLFNLPDSAIQHWKNHTQHGIEYDFSHLKSSKHTFEHPKRSESYTLYFTYSHHTFTRSIKKGEPSDPNTLYPHPTDLRAFDVVRYELSKHLPNIIATLPDQFCYHGGYSRYCSCKIEQTDGTTIYYQVVYRVWKERGKMRFHIESAYPLEEGLPKVKKVDFWVICHNLLRGKKLPKPAA